MKLSGYYSSGQFARMADVSLRTIRFYDKQDILKPSYVSPAGARFYTDADFARLQQILLFKYFGFSLEDIRALFIRDADGSFLLDSLRMQRKLVRDRIEQLQLMDEAIGETETALAGTDTPDWSRMLHLIHLTDMDKSLKAQYQNASNISARIRLHGGYSVNSEGWFPWLYRQCGVSEGMRILELGCGDGTLWRENRAALPARFEVVLSDVSDGMLRDAKRGIGAEDERFSFRAFDCHAIPFEAGSFDLVLANHVLFYCGDISLVLKEVRRVLRPGGLFLCSTYGAQHMQEIRELVRQFDSRILLSADNLYERFGLENGEGMLSECFEAVELRRYEDAIELTEAEPLIAYILSCHGNQNRLLLNRYPEFRTFVEKNVQDGFHITKEAGAFLCR